MVFDVILICFIRFIKIKVTVSFLVFNNGSIRLKSDLITKQLRDRSKVTS